MTLSEILKPEIIIGLIIVFISHILIYCYVVSGKKKCIRNQHVVVTGGSSGIGLWIAINCVKLGANVTIIARRTSILEKAHKLLEAHRVHDDQKIQFKSIDLSLNYETVELGLSELEKEVGPVYMLVNCAGMAICGTVDEMSISDAKLMMDINYYATFYPTRYVLSKLKSTGEGIIVITSSQAALIGVYGYGPYAAAKFALRGLAETIAMEVSDKNISITLALPADTDTPGFANEEKTKPLITKIISSSGGLAKPEDVGLKILNDALKGNFFSIYGLESWIITVLCSGMSPWGGITFNILLSTVIGPLKVLGSIIQWNFRRIVRNTKNENQKS